ncbi:trissin [Drosophila sulfurigaster albostrigata]|uniref:trissin n=1 Tax=Drosophila sulfurigaster albostrigata TaxID=89887 RepID=UPI002D2194D4|nr:trissin [Drosophila sulfurigaster albostrigata]
MHIQIILLCICFMWFTCSDAIPCDSCGKECASACGTKHFRTCCFNYLRKRADPDALRQSSNKRLIDFILLQGHALFTQELRERRNNGTLIDLDFNTYYA